MAKTHPDERWQERVSALVDGEGWAWGRWVLRMHLERCPACRMLYERMAAIKRVVRERAPRPEVPAALWEGAAGRFGQQRRAWVVLPMMAVWRTSALGIIGVLTIFAGSWAALWPTRAPHSWLDAAQAHYAVHRTSGHSELAQGKAPQSMAFPVDLGKFGLEPASAGPCTIGGLPTYCYVYRSSSEHCWAVISRVSGLCERVAGLCPRCGSSCGHLGGSAEGVRIYAWPSDSGCVCLSVHCGNKKGPAVARAVAEALAAKR